jgi:hypothetical protein
MDNLRLGSTDMEIRSLGTWALGGGLLTQDLLETGYCTAMEPVSGISTQV